MMLCNFLVFVQVVVHERPNVIVEATRDERLFLSQRTNIDHSRLFEAPYTMTVPCVICRSLSCYDALNNLLGQENYYS